MLNDDESWGDWLRYTSQPSGHIAAYGYCSEAHSMLTSSWGKDPTWNGLCSHYPGTLHRILHERLEGWDFLTGRTMDPDK